MVYSIENEHLIVKISSLGAEIISVVLKSDFTEYIWQGDKKYWSGHSPIMFPICGRLFGGKYTYQAKTYELGCHGFAKLNEFDLLSAKNDSISFVLKSNKSIKKDYPFDFEFVVSYTLKDKKLIVSFSVKNTDSKELIYSFGGHPAFNVPLSKSESFEDYHIIFDRKTMAFKVDLTDTCFCSGNDKLYDENGLDDIPLKHTLFDNDAIFLYNVSKAVCLKSSKSKHFVKVNFDNFKYIGFWHKPKSDAPYVCIEPWNSIPSMDGIVDDLETKKEMTHLPSGFTNKASYSIEFE